MHSSAHLSADAVYVKTLIGFEQLLSALPNLFLKNIRGPTLQNDFFQQTLASFG